MFFTAILCIIWGVTWMIIGVMAGVSWLAFCFGSLIAVVLILLFAPPLLFLPFGLSVYGLAIFSKGIDMLRNSEKY